MRCDSPDDAYDRWRDEHGAELDKSLLKMRRNAAWWRIRFDLKWFAKYPRLITAKHLAHSVANLVSVHKPPAWDAQPFDPDVVVGAVSVLLAIICVVLL